MFSGTRDIKALKVKCDNLTKSCDWMGELGSLETHLESCDYALVPCTNECKTGCDTIVKFPRKDLKHHLANDCPRRQRKCPHCKKMGEFQEMTTTHLGTCPQLRVGCPNTDCGTKILRCNLATHLSTCKYEFVTCKYAAVGCNERPSRKELKEHEEDALLHLQVTTDKNLELTQKVAFLEASKDALKEELMKVKSVSLTPTTLKLNKYQERKNSNKVIYSPPLYTSYSGYKMCFTLIANGWGVGRGTSVSVYAYLMKGDHDDTLTWPFTGTVTIELLNQLEDMNHHKNTFKFTAANAMMGQRVRDSERATQGWGWPNLISHAALDYNVKANTQYLKDDTLVFRISVKAFGHKPWLECTV